MKNITLILVLVLGIGLESFAEKYPIMMRYGKFTPNDVKNEMTGVVVTPLKSYQRFYFKNFLLSLTGEKDFDIIFDRFTLIKNKTLESGSYLNSRWDFSSKWKIETYPGKYYEGDLYEYIGPKIFKGKIFFKPSCGNILLIPDSSLSENDEPFVDRVIKPEVNKQPVVYDNNYQPPQQYQQQIPPQMRQGYWIASSGVIKLNDGFDNSYGYYPRGWNGRNSWFPRWDGTVGRVIINQHRGCNTTTRRR